MLSDNVKVSKGSASKVHVNSHLDHDVHSRKVHHQSHIPHILGNTGEIELSNHTDNDNDNDNDNNNNERNEIDSSDSPVELEQQSLLLDNKSSHNSVNQRDHDSMKKPVTWRKEWSAIVLLICLYTLQGVPLGLSFGSIPFLLQQAASENAKSSTPDSGTNYTDLGIFSLAVWPYSLKLLWSPIVDCYYSNSIGRRKSWIIPTQLLIGIFMIWYSYFILDLIHNNSINYLSVSFFLLIVLVATQDIAVDGWALSLLSSDNLSYASTCQSIGQNIGYFLSYSVFLALNEFKYSNLAQYMFYWGIGFIICTMYIAIYKSESPIINNIESESVIELYKRIYRILKLKPVQRLVIMLFTCRLAFLAVDTITIYKLTEYGFPRETMAMLVFILFPFEMVFPVLITNYSKKNSSNNSLKTWIMGYPLRMIGNCITLITVYCFPGTPIPLYFYLWIILISILGSFTSNIHFVSQCGFFAEISDESIGGTYMTLLNTVANLGGTWPKFLIYAAVDRFTCKSTDTNCNLLKPGTDGYYIVSLIGFGIGIIWLYFMKDRVIQLGKIEKRYWSTQ